MTAVPHFAFPFRLGPGGRMAVVEQDSLDEIAQNVGILMLTRPGSRIEIPEFGTRTLLFREPGGTDVDLAASQALEWEPRAAIALQENPDRMDDLVRRVRATVSPGGE